MIPNMDFYMLCAFLAAYHLRCFYLTMCFSFISYQQIDMVPHEGDSISSGEPIKDLIQETD